MISKKLKKPKLPEDILYYEEHGRLLPGKSVLWNASLIIRGHVFSCQIRNLSVGGLKIKLDIPFKDGVIGTIRIPKYNLHLRVKVAWHSDGFFGLQFIEDHQLVREQFSEGAAIIGVDAIRFMDSIS